MKKENGVESVINFDNDVQSVVLKVPCLGDEEIIVAMTPDFRATGKKHPGKVLYSYLEIPVVEELRLSDPKGLKIVHELKRAFEGWIEPKLCTGFRCKKRVSKGAVK